MIYLKNGNIPLNSAFSDEIIQEANSTYQLTFKFPVSDGLFKELKEEVLLLADDLHGEQEFIIIEIVNNNGYCTVYANQVASLLNSYSISELNANRVSGVRVMSLLAGSIVRDNEFSLSSDIQEEHTLNIKNTSVMNVLVKDKHSVLGRWGGDLVRDKYDIRLLKNGGSENESLFMYKKNIKTYNQNKSIKDLRTRIHFTKKLENKENETEEKISVTIDSPLINKYQNIYEYDLEVNDQDVVDLATLTKYGQRYFKETLCDILEESIEIDIVGIDDVDVRLFDTVTIFHEQFNLDIRKKISKYTYSSMGKKLKKIGFGKVQQGLSSTISSMVSSDVAEQTSNIQYDIQARVNKELKNADLAFNREAEKIKQSIQDGIERNKAETEVIRSNIQDQLNSKLGILSHVQDEVRDIRDSFRTSLENTKRELLNSSGRGVNSEVARAIENARQEATNKISEANRNAESLVNSARSEATRLTNEAKEFASGLVSDISVGGRNLARGTSDEWSEPFTSFSGVENTRIYLEKIYNKNLKIGDTLSIRLFVKCSNLVPAQNKIIKLKFQASGDVTEWSKSSLHSEWINDIQNGIYEIKTQIVIDENHLKNNFWWSALRIDNLESGIIKYRCFMAENATVYSDWNRAPDDYKHDIEQLNNGFIERLSRIESSNDSLIQFRNEIKITTDGTNRELSKITRLFDEHGNLNQLIDVRREIDDRISDVSDSLSLVEHKFNSQGKLIQLVNYENTIRRTIDSINQIISKVENKFDDNGKLKELESFKNDNERDLNSIRESLTQVRSRFSIGGELLSLNRYKNEMISTIQGINSEISTFKQKFNEDGSLKEFRQFQNERFETDRQITQKLSALEEYKNDDINRQTRILQLTETKTSELLERQLSNISDNYVAKNTLNETIQGVERNILSNISTSSNNLLKNSNQPFIDIINYGIGSYYLSENIEDDEEVTLTLKVKFSDDRRKYIEPFNSGGSVSFGIRYRLETEQISNQYYIISKTFRWRSINSQGVKMDNSKIIFWHFDRNNPQTASIEWATLVRGKFGTLEWIPSKFDNANLVDSKLATYKQTIDENLSSLTQTINSNQSLTSTLQQTINSFNTTVSNVTNRLDELGNSVGVLESYKTQREQTDRIISNKVTALENDTLRLSSVTTTAEGVLIASGKTFDGNTIASMIKVSPEAINIISDNIAISANNEKNLVIVDKRNRVDFESRYCLLTDNYTDVYKSGDEFFIEADVTASDLKWPLFFVPFIVLENGREEYPYSLLKQNDSLGKSNVSTSLKLPQYDSKIKSVKFTVLQYTWSNYTSWTLENSKIYLKRDAKLLVDGSVTSKQIAANTITAREILAATITGAEIAAGTIDTKHLKANSVEANQIFVNEAFINKLLVDNLLAKKLVASEAFIAKLNAITINATQIVGGTISGDFIRGGIIRGTTIEGATIQGNSLIKIGAHGFLKPAETGIHICSPASAGARNGVGVQVLGNTGRNKDSPYGLYVYVDPDFYSRDARSTDSYLMTVNGYIKCRGIGGLKWIEYTDGSAGIRLWSGNRPELVFDTDGNDIKYKWNGTTYGLWGLITNYYDTSSDIKIKYSIRDSESNAINLIEKLKFKQFNYIKNDIFDGSKVDIGLIAQDVAKIDKKLVKYKKDILSLDSFRLLNIALKAIQELSQENKKMKQEIQELKGMAA